METQRTSGEHHEPSHQPRLVTAPFDAARAERFAARMLDIVNGGFLTLMTSLGHRTRLFDVLASLPPSTSPQIARAAGLNERYVREWLGAMVTGRVVDYAPSERRYNLPPEHAACLTSAAGANNLAELTQGVPLLAQVESRFLEVFRHGGGLGDDAFPGFHALMAEWSQKTLESTLFTRMLPLVAGLAERLEAGLDVADVGCGRGVAVLMLARRFPRSHFLGLDLSQDAIDGARAEGAREKLGNAAFSVEDAAGFAWPRAYDLITAFDAIHDQAWPRRVLRGIRQGLRPGGVFLMQDIATSSFWSATSTIPSRPCCTRSRRCTARACRSREGARGSGLAGARNRRASCSPTQASHTSRWLSSTRIR